MWTLLAAAALAQDIAYDPTIHRYYTACGRTDVVDLDRIDPVADGWEVARTRWRLDGEALRLALLHPYAPILVNAAVDEAVRTRVCEVEDFHEAVPRLLAAGVTPPRRAVPVDTRERLDVDLALTRGWRRPPEGPVVYSGRVLVGPSTGAVTDGAWRPGGAVDARVGVADGVFGGLMLGIGRARVDDGGAAVATRATFGLQAGVEGGGGHTAWLGVGQLGRAAALGADVVVGRVASGIGLATVGFRAEWGAWADAPWTAVVGVGLGARVRPLARR